MKRSFPSKESHQEPSGNRPQPRENPLETPESRKKVRARTVRRIGR